MGCIDHYETHIKNLTRSFTQYELAILSKIQFEKNNLRLMDEMSLCNNISSDLKFIEQKEFFFIKDW